MLNWFRKPRYNPALETVLRVLEQYPSKWKEAFVYPLTGWKFGECSILVRRDEKDQFTIGDLILDKRESKILANAINKWRMESAAIALSTS